MHQPSGVVDPMSFGLLADLRSTSASHARAKSGVRSAILLYAYEKRSSGPIKQFRPSVCECDVSLMPRPKCVINVVLSSLEYTAADPAQFGCAISLNFSYEL